MGAPGGFFYSSGACNSNVASGKMSLMNRRMKKRANLSFWIFIGMLVRL